MGYAERIETLQSLPQDKRAGQIVLTPFSYTDLS
jgi:hypothetical protein